MMNRKYSSIYRETPDKKYTVLWLLVSFLFAGCAGQRESVILRPDPAQDISQEQTGPRETWQIIEAQDNADAAAIPDWVNFYLNNDIRGIEALDALSGRYVFVAGNRGDNFNALQQWANGFAIAQDLPYLIALRVEQRLVGAAALYPDDEYGEYFANMIKQVSDGEYTEALKEQTYWVKKSIQVINTEYGETPPESTEFERYEFMVLVTINKETLQENIKHIMANIKTAAAPTRNQAAAIKKINETFFEEF